MQSCLRTIKIPSKKRKNPRFFNQGHIFDWETLMFLIQSPNRSETSFPHFETSAQKVKPPLKKVKPILFLSETSRFHRCFSANASFSPLCPSRYGVIDYDLMARH